MTQLNLKNGYTIKVMPESEFFPLFSKHYDSIFGSDHTFFADSHYTEAEKQKLKALQERLGNIYGLHLGLFDQNNNFVGFSFGYQETEETFYMAASAVLPEHRKQGLYTELLKVIIEKTTEMGFQKIYGTHCATNNAVIIPKLKMGFLFSKIELSDMFGTIIHLQYYTNPLRRKVLDYRSGLKVPDQQIKSIMKFGIS